MADKHYDIFISYRREGGKNYARVIKPELEKRGFSVFLDFDELKDGKFDQRILDAIDDAPIFMLILSNGCLDRCVNDDDWVRQEILYANRNGKHIIPVEVDKSFRQIPDIVPDDVRNIVGQHQFSQVDTETLLQASMDELVRYRVQSYVTIVAPNSQGAEIHVETDADCTILRFQKEIGRAIVGEDTIIRLKKGKHKLDFVSLKINSVRQSVVVEVPDNDYSDFVEVRLQDKINANIQSEYKKKEAEEQVRREAEERKRREEDMRHHREEEERRIKEEERRKQQEEEQRRKKENENGEKQKNIFISYSRRNYHTVMEIKQQLDTAIGTECLIDSDDLPRSINDRVKDILNAIRFCEVFIFTLSKESQQSEMAESMILYARDIGKKIIPVNIDGCEIKKGSFQFLFSSMDIVNWNIKIQRERLIRNLRGILNKE